MTRRIVYGMGVWATAAATALTVAAIILPRWITWQTAPDVRYSYGLHQRCSSITGGCKEFPTEEDCNASSQSFCSMWRSVGFFMSFAVIIELASFIAYAVIILGGKQQRDFGWKIVCSLLAVGAVVQCAGMAVVAFLYDNDERFFPGWRLDTSWILCTVSWSILTLTAVGIGACAYALPEEGGYELIPPEY